MQRLFSTFADGWPGAGLLLLRLFTGVALIHSGIIRPNEGSPLVTVALKVFGVAAGVVLMVGLFTPVVGALTAIAQVWVAVSQISSHLGDPWSAMAQGTLAAGLAMIGPGAWSLDARRFGRKRIDLMDDR
jgi:putative oxidoreductase